jgi:hypothetical protein
MSAHNSKILIMDRTSKRFCTDDNLSCQRTTITIETAMATEATAFGVYYHCALTLLLLLSQVEGESVEIFRQQNFKNCAWTWHRSFDFRSCSARRKLQWLFDRQFIWWAFFRCSCPLVWWLLATEFEAMPAAVIIFFPSFLDYYVF